MRERRYLRSGERGSASVELVLLTPVLVSLLLLTVALGRLASVNGTVSDAARDAARSAANARTAVEARNTAMLLARSLLDGNDAGCDSPSVIVDTSDWRAGGSVAVTVRCPVPLTDVAGFGIGGTRTIDARFVEPLDRWKGLR